MSTPATHLSHFPYRSFRTRPFSPVDLTPLPCGVTGVLGCVVGLNRKLSGKNTTENDLNDSTNRANFLSRNTQGRYRSSHVRSNLNEDKFYTLPESPLSFLPSNAYLFIKRNETKINYQRNEHHVTCHIMDMSNNGRLFVTQWWRVYTCGTVGEKPIKDPSLKVLCE